MTTKDFISKFDTLFGGRRDVYAEGYPDPNKPEKYRYATVREPLTAAVLNKHLHGDTCVGVYPLVESNVNWFAVDFDAPKDAEGKEVANAWEISLEAGKAQVQAFEKAGLQVYLERSRSGKGVHVWGFLGEYMAADVVRRALKPLLTDHTIFASRDRMYPVQPNTSGLQEGMGNLIALPFYGGVRKQGFSSFIDARSSEIIPPKDFLATVKLNEPAVLIKLADKTQTTVSVRRKYPQTTDVTAEGYQRPPQPFSGALKLISVFGCKFMRHAWLNRRSLSEPEWYAAIQQTTCLQNGLEFAKALSKDYPGYSETEVVAKFEQAMRNAPVGCSWIKENYPELACENCPVRAPYFLANKPLLDLAQTVATSMEKTDGMVDDIARIQRLDSKQETLGIPWGIPTLDKYVRLRNSEMIVVGAMQSIGKTGLMVDAALRLSRRGVPVFVFSPETGRTSLRMRLLARAAEVDNLALRGEREEPLTELEWQRVYKAGNELEQLPIYVDYGATTADDVLRQVEDTLLQHELPLDTPGVLFFDYLQFGAKQIGDDNEYTRLSRLSAEFKYVAKCLDRPVVVFSQLKREHEGDEDPEINWFKGTGRIESDMDVGLIITGPRVEGRHAPRRIFVVKQREGRANVAIDMLFDQTCFKFEDVNTTIDKLPSLLSGEELGEFGK